MGSLPVGEIVFTRHLTSSGLRGKSASVPCSHTSVNKAVAAPLAVVSAHTALPTAHSPDVPASRCSRVFTWHRNKL